MAVCEMYPPENQKEGGIRGEHGSRPEIASAIAGNQTSAEVCAIRMIPNFNHKETGKFLDSRM